MHPPSPPLPPAGRAGRAPAARFPRATAHDPADRYQSATELGAALTRHMAPGNPKAWLAAPRHVVPARDRHRGRDARQADRHSHDRQRRGRGARRGRPRTRSHPGHDAGRPVRGPAPHRPRRDGGRVRGPAHADPQARGDQDREPTRARSRARAPPAGRGQAAGRIEHPNVAAVNDSGTTPGGNPFFVMEYLDGEGLDAIVRREGALDPARAVRIVGEICKAAAAAHAAGVLHRDLKPGNVMLVGSDDGHERVKVLEFGLAKLMRGSADLPAGPLDGLTRPEAALGTPAYMAPEQLTAGAAVDGRADVYAIATIAYELLTGALPLGEAEPEALVWRKLREDPGPPSARRPGLSPALDRAVLRGLSRAPGDRPAGAGEFAAKLLQALAAPPVDPDHDGAPRTAGQPGRAWTRGRLGGLVGIALLFIGAAGVLVVRARPRTPPAVTPAPIPPPRPAVVPGPIIAPTPARPAVIERPPAAATPPVVSPRPPRASPRVPPRPAPQRGAQGLVDAAWEALEEKHFARAMDLGRAALAAGAGGPAHFLLGKAALAAGKRREALGHFQRALAENPRDTEAASMAENVRRLIEESP